MPRGYATYSRRIFASGQHVREVAQTVLNGNEATRPKVDTDKNATESTRFHNTLGR